MLLTPNWTWLLEVGLHRVHCIFWNIPIENGEPCPCVPLRITCKRTYPHKRDSRVVPSPEMVASTPHVQDLMRDMKRLKKGTITLKFQDGLPIACDIDEVLEPPRL